MNTRPPAMGIEAALSRYSQEILEAMRAALQRVEELSRAPGAADTAAFYGQMRYHLGWADAAQTPVAANPGKLLRPTLLLLAYEATGANGSADETGHRYYLSRALPAAAALELTHNFTLIHDDIEDGDTERRHRPTLWKLWGIPQAINTGDGMFALSRLALWSVLDQGVEPAIAARLGALLDRACLVIAEGQYLDISFEDRPDLSVALYLDMIHRKTAELMGCAAEMGARLGTVDEEAIRRLRSFGEAMGLAFQVRDDMLGTWAASEESGKMPAGDLYRRKKSLPILHAFEHASLADQQALRLIYTQREPVGEAQVRDILAIFARTETRTYCRAFLARQCQAAYTALAAIPRSSNAIATRALRDMETLVAYVEAATKSA